MLDLSETILDVYSDLHTWQKVGDKYGISRGMAYRIAVNKYEPKTPEIRKKLGLPVAVSVIPVSGEIPPGSQSLGASYCIRCGKPYIPNHPRRRKCFVCSAYRKRL